MASQEEWGAIFGIFWIFAAATLKNYRGVDRDISFGSQSLLCAKCNNTIRSGYPGRMSHTTTTCRTSYIGPFSIQDLQYSCAYFTAPGVSLDEVQRAKKHHIASKLLLRPGHRVLDIGCGWGGLALSLAQAEDVSVLGITLSQEQLVVARKRARELGLQSRVEFRLQDYRLVEGKFDRIVSVGILEHLGAPHYGEFFERVFGLLADQGVALIHSNGRHREQEYVLKSYRSANSSEIPAHFSGRSMDCSSSLRCETGRDCRQ
jgi:cyclopropane fatty-acyl-phospholipid synthase-like methyltransferase